MPISHDSLIAAWKACLRQSDLAYLRYPDMYDGSAEAEAQWAATRATWFYSRRFLDAAQALKDNAADEC